MFSNGLVLISKPVWYDISLLEPIHLVKLAMYLQLIISTVKPV